jgi:hypothetical protein
VLIGRNDEAKPKLGQKLRPVVSCLPEFAEGDPLSYGTGSLIAEVKYSGMVDGLASGEYIRHSCRHIYDKNINEKVAQPAGLGDVVGEVVADAPYDNLDSAFRSMYEFEHGVVVNQGLPNHNGTIPDSELEEGDRMAMYGARSEFDTGEFRYGDVGIRVNYPSETKLIDGVFRVDGIGAGGDSGAPVIRQKDNKLAGILFAGTPSVGYCIPARRVEEHFGVKFLTGPELSERYIDEIAGSDVDTDEVVDAIVDYNSIDHSSRPTREDIVDLIVRHNENNA